MGLPRPILRNAPGRPIGPATVEERRRRYAAITRCASYCEEVIDLHLKIMRDEGEPSPERRAAAKWLWESAFGKPVQAIDTNVEGQQTVKHVYEVRWLPPDPADQSKVIEPEKD